MIRVVTDKDTHWISNLTSQIMRFESNSPHLIERELNQNYLCKSISLVLHSGTKPVCYAFVYRVNRKEKLAHTHTHTRTRTHTRGCLLKEAGFHTHSHRD